MAGTSAADAVIDGGSPRASIALMKTAQALPLYDGLTYVTPDHIDAVAVAVEAVAHRLVLNPQARHGGVTERAVLTDILERVPTPA